jgi:hypothetical protein
MILVLAVVRKFILTPCFRKFLTRARPIRPVAPAIKILCCLLCSKAQKYYFFFEARNISLLPGGPIKRSTSSPTSNMALRTLPLAQ